MIKCYKIRHYDKGKKKQRESGGIDAIVSKVTLRFLLPISCMFMERNPLNEITRAKVYIAEEPLINWYGFSKMKNSSCKCLYSFTSQD